MNIQVSFDLQNDATIVIWPWGQQAFPYSTEGAGQLSEALKNFAIETSRRGVHNIANIHVSNEEKLAIRRAVEGGQIKRYEEGSSGMEKKLTLAELFDEVE